MHNTLRRLRAQKLHACVPTKGVAVGLGQLLAPLGALIGACGCAAAPRRAQAPTRAVRLVRAGPDRGDDTWGKGQVLAYCFACVSFCSVCRAALLPVVGLQAACSHST